MNYIEQVAKMLGVEVGEKFNILDGNGCLLGHAPYKLTTGRLLGHAPYKLTTGCGLVDNDGDRIGTVLHAILRGAYTIQKLPWKPKTGDEVWFVNPLGACYSIIFSRYNDFSVLLYSVENCFESEEEAEKNKEKVLAMYDKLREELA